MEGKMNKKLTIRAAIATLASTLLFAPAVAIAQTAWEAQARTYLENEAATYLPDYSLSQRLMIGSLNTGATQSRTVRLQGGVEYALLGACDDDCSDLDLRLFSNRGSTLIDVDDEPDDFPLVTVTPSRTANYQIQAEMYSCSSEPCYYAIGVYRR